MTLFEWPPVEVSEAQPIERPTSRVEAPANVRDTGHNPAKVSCVRYSAIRGNDREEDRDAGHRDQKVLALYRKYAKQVDFALRLQDRESGQKTKNASRGPHDTPAEVTRKRPAQQRLQKATDNTAGKVKLQEVGGSEPFFDEPAEEPNTDEIAKKIPQPAVQELKSDQLPNVAVA